jgi:hypothetical protein
LLIWKVPANSLVCRSLQGYQTYLNAFKDLERRTASLQTEIEVIQKDFEGAVEVVQWQMNHQEDMKDFERVRNAPAE